ncbi:MAG TPA: acyltransferase [Candidatus Limnocylindrales bacterium]|nr:acyltransferase [Candidatus Limnocylindrales bacterium]
MQASQTGQGQLPSTLNSLTGLRFLSAFLVFLAHTVGFLLVLMVNPAQDQYSRFFFSGANAGVTFFFILSGFILTWVAQSNDTKPAFWRRRFFKIYPNHLVAFAATVALMVYAGYTLTASNTLPTLFLIQSWIPSYEVSHFAGGNTPTWTLACEMLFYFLFPWLLVAARRVKAANVWKWVWAVVVAIVAVPVIAQLLLPREPIMQWDPIPWWHYWFVTHLPVTRLLEFALGILMAQVVLHRKWIRIKLAPALLIAAASLAVAAYLPDEYDQVAPMALPIALVIAAAATNDINGKRTFFASRTMIWLGEISYAFYIVHFLVVNYGPMGAAYQSFWTKQWTAGTAVRDTVLTLAISVVLAWLLYRFVERPAMRHWSRSKARRAATVTTQTTAPVALAAEDRLDEREPASSR